MPVVGDVLDVYFVGMKEGAALLTPSLSGSSAAVDQSIRQAFESKMSLEGLVEKECNGGYEVTVAGQRAFCPYSQIDLNRSRDNAATYIGQRMTFLVSEYEPEDHTLVVSHREVLERERASKREGLRAELKEGDVRAGVVTNIMPFGVFVDIGGVEGLIPLKELSWDRSKKPEDLVTVGQSVTVSIVALDWEANRFTLSLRSSQTDPWTEFAEEYGVGQYLTVTVTKLMPFGAFALIQPGVEGLIPISKLGGGRRILHPREAVSEGDKLDVQIESIDPAQRRVSLKPVDARIQALKPGEIAVGATLKGLVEGIREFGVFVRLSEEKTGLLHIGECGIERGGNPVSKLERKFAAGSEIEVIVKSIDGTRIGLTLPGTGTDGDEDGEDLVELLRKSNGPASKTFGSLGGMFDNVRV
jgi:small subunit ribosomal protein S1